MSLPLPPQEWSTAYQARLNAELEHRDRSTLKRGRDMEVGRARIVLTAPDGSRWALRVDAGGRLSTEPA